MNRLIAVNDVSKVVKYTYFANGSKGELTSYFSYKYDNNKNITQVIDSKGTTTNSYDKLNRLSSVTTLDGNRSTEKVTKGQSSFDKVYVYDIENRLTKTVDNLTGITLENNFAFMCRSR